MHGQDAHATPETAAMNVPEELEELRVGVERLRTLLENLTVRGLRACGPDELAQLGSYCEHFDGTGAGHLASALAALKRQIEQEDPQSAKTLLETQLNVRLLERLLTMRVVKAQYSAALALDEPSTPAAVADVSSDEDED
jgi:hypothetical protein